MSRVVLQRAHQSVFIAGVVRAKKRDFVGVSLGGSVESEAGAVAASWVVVWLVRPNQAPAGFYFWVISFLPNFDLNLDAHASNMPQQTLT